MSCVRRQDFVARSSGVDLWRRVRAAEREIDAGAAASRKMIGCGRGAASFRRKTTREEAGTSFCRHVIVDTGSKRASSRLERTPH